MVPPDGARTKLPTLSWDSVVDAAEPDTPVADSSPDAVLTPENEPITLTPLSLDLDLSAGPHDPVSAPEPTAAPVFPSQPPPPVPTPVAAAAPVVDDTVVVRTTPPAVIVPAIGDVTSGPDSLSTAAPVAPAAPIMQAPTTDALPVIQEATPVDLGTPTLPTISAPAPRPTTATPFEFDPASVVPPPVRQPGRRKKRGGLKLVVTLLVLIALVAGGLVLGQSYLFPGDWDDATAPYAETVVAATGVEFAEPLSIVAEPTADFATRLQVQFATVPPDQLARWRALGLASGAVDDVTIAQQLTGWQDAVYSTIDGQVYHDAGAMGPALDPQLTQEMAAASLDQQFGWSVEQPRRTLDAAAATSAEVLRQTRAVAQSSSFAGPVPPVPTEVVDVLPPVIGYRMLAPHVYAQFDATIDAGDGTNVLADLGTGGPGILGRDMPTVAAGPTMLDGDVATAAPVARDRSFWYLVFAGYLDARTAYDASEAVVESAITAATRGNTQCVSATFSGTGVEATATLRDALTAWSASAPAEMVSSFQVLPDGTLQLVSCDPGAGFDAATRPGVARELLSWRMAELATMEAAIYGGGGEAQFLDAWTFVEASPMALDLMSLPPTTSPADMAVAARAGFDALLNALG
jgi:hypothetical protein